MFSGVFFLLFMYEITTTWKASKYGVFFWSVLSCITGIRDSVRIHENTDQKKLRIWTLSTQWALNWICFGVMDFFFSGYVRGKVRQFFYHHLQQILMWNNFLFAAGLEFSSIFFFFFFFLKLLIVRTGRDLKIHSKVANCFHLQVPNKLTYKST